MDMSGEERIAAPREAVWAALNDPEVLKACIPGCQSLTMKSPTEPPATPVSGNALVSTEDTSLTRSHAPELAVRRTRMQPESAHYDQ